MLFFEATSTIDASPDDVWAVVADGGSWPSWDSGVDEVTGTIALGDRVTIRAAVSPGRAFPVTVTTFDPPHLLRLQGGMPLGLFRGIRTYALSPAPAGGTSFHLREEYSGLLAGLIGRSIPDLHPSFEQFATGLKHRVESGS